MREFTEVEQAPFLGHAGPDDTEVESTLSEIVNMDLKCSGTRLPLFPPSILDKYANRRFFGILNLVSKTLNPHDTFFIEAKNDEEKAEILTALGYNPMLIARVDSWGDNLPGFVGYYVQCEQ